MKAKELRQKYIQFFKEKGHREIKSAPLVPENDPTVLFTTAGMHPLVPFLLGETHPLGSRLVNYQKCIRTGDIDEVGDDVHLTFFEMLGNWSLGDYFKEEAITWSFEFLTSPKWLHLPLERLAVSVFQGDEDAPFDDISYTQWLSLGIAPERIAKLGKKDNWWGPAGQTGPCGPDTEMFYWVGDLSAPAVFDPEDRRWVEIWNDVFMQYNKQADGTFKPLAKQNVDTGMGLERVTCVLQGKSSCYDTELFEPLFAILSEISGCATPRDSKSGRIVVEHLRSAAFIMADGISPGNVDQAYVLRRLIRRAIREGHQLGITEPFSHKIAAVVVDEYGDIYRELVVNRERILEELQMEEEKFSETLVKGIREFNKMIERVPEHVKRKIIAGRNAFDLYQTYGFPVEVTTEMAKEHGFEVDMEGFQKAFEKHQEISRAGAERFKGGLADHSDKTTALHTATHLLHQALRSVLGEHVQQKGSNITHERLRFDFSHDDKISDEDLAKVEQLVNEQISRALPITNEEMDVESAKVSGALGFFEERYGDRVKVYTIGDYSKEICGGPHVTNTAELVSFKILKEQASSRGVRRIKAVLGTE